MTRAQQQYILVAGLILGVTGCTGDPFGRELGDGSRYYGGDTDTDGGGSSGGSSGGSPGADDSGADEHAGCQATCRLLQIDNNGFPQPLDDSGDPIGPPPNSQGVPYMIETDVCRVDPWPLERDEYDQDGDLLGRFGTLSGDARCGVEWDELHQAYAKHGEGRRASIELECDFTPECPDNAKASVRFTGDYEGRIFAKAHGRYLNYYHQATARAEARASVVMPEAVVSEGEQVRGHDLTLRAASGHRSDEFGCLLEVVSDVWKKCFVELSTDPKKPVVGKCRISVQQVLDGQACFHDPTAAVEKEERFSSYIPSANHAREVTNGGTSAWVGDMAIQADFTVEAQTIGINWGYPIAATAETRVEATLAVDQDNSYCTPNCGEIDWDGATSVTLRLPDDHSVDWDTEPG